MKKRVGCLAAAAGLAVKQRETVKDIDRERLKKLLLEQGAWLG